jgi:hypothetical protein
MERGKTVEECGLWRVPFRRRLFAAGAVLAAATTLLCANVRVLRAQVLGQLLGAQVLGWGEPAAQAAQSSAPTDVNDSILNGGLTVTGGKAEAVEYQGRKAVRLLTTEKGEDVFAFLKGTQIQDGTIEADIAIKITTPPGVRMPGFVGIAFRARTDASHYDMFYIRPRNSRTEDQAMRNHSVQYVAAPGFDWYKLRREWPWIYESYAELQPEGWNKVKIEVHGRTAKLYINGAENPSLMVNGLKGEDLTGGVALWGYAGEEAYFSNVKVTPAKAEAVTNDGEASGTWEVIFASDYGRFGGSMNLRREGNAVKGTWSSGEFGKELPVSGAWRNGYVELTFNGGWPSDKPDEKPAPMTATLAGWIDGDSARGRMKVERRADGQWTAVRKK